MAACSDEEIALDVATEDEYLAESTEDNAKTKARSGSKKQKRKRKPKVGWDPDYANARNKYTKLTFLNRVGIDGMKSFLTKYAPYIDVETNYAEGAKQRYYDSYGNPQARGQAMADECIEVHERLLHATQLRKEEEIRWQEKADRFMRGERSTSAPSEFNSFPHWPGDLPDAAAVQDSHLTTIARRDLQSIRNRAEDQINTAYEKRQQIASDMHGLELDGDGQPLISACVQRLVYQVVSAQECAYRVREYHGPQAKGQLSSLTTVFHSLRFQLRHELQIVLNIEADVDRSATAQKLVVQEFPPQV